MLGFAAQLLFVTYGLIQITENITTLMEGVTEIFR